MCSVTLCLYKTTKQVLRWVPKVILENKRYTIKRCIKEAFNVTSYEASNLASSALSIVASNATSNTNQYFSRTLQKIIPGAVIIKKKLRLNACDKIIVQRILVPIEWCDFTIKCPFQVELFNSLLQVQFVITFRFFYCFPVILHIWLKTKQVNVLECSVWRPESHTMRTIVWAPFLNCFSHKYYNLKWSLLVCDTMRHGKYPKNVHSSCKDVINDKFFLCNTVHKTLFNDCIHVILNGRLERPSNHMNICKLNLFKESKYLQTFRHIEATGYGKKKTTFITICIHY